ncbi:MAG TPA: phenylalanine--tRNA ligase subunit beta [Terriglobales bacterium]|nr:phenylalanine--tRNA ligase subunit beta [Terriglobales bacterium]
MKISPQWLREFVDLKKVDLRTLATDLTMAGTSVESVSSEGDGTIFEMEITTNRPDCMNHHGVARECSAIYDLELKPLEAKLPAAKDSSDFKIEIEDPQGCARYTARIIRNVTIKPSPARIQKRLESLDARPINNAADATNYNLMEMGHPTHAFDLDLLEGGKIVVRRAREGEFLKTLDGVGRTLTKDDLVIADASKAVALAGVMGGFDTMITDKTRNVLVESAWFDPATVRATAKRHGLHSDASHRFERGADWGATPLACSLVAQHIIEWGGGELEGGEIDAAARSLARQPIQVSRSEVRRILGQDISDIERILTRLGFGVLPAGDTFAVTIPTWRLDVEREIDVIEEIARIHGYNRFPNTLPSFSGGVIELPEAARDSATRTTLLALGYHEALSVTFISHADAKAFSSAAVVELENPLNEEMSVMRTSLAPSMLNMLAYNLNRGSDNVKLFEAGNVYELAGGRTQERKQIAMGATGLAEPASVHQKGRPYSFFDLKGDVETLLGEFQYDSLYFDAGAADHYHPGRSARAVMDGATVARFGQVHPEVAAARKIKQDVYVAELYLDRLYAHGLREARYEPLSKFPAVERDFSFLMDDTVRWENIRGSIDALKLGELRGFSPAEIFRGGAVPAGKHSILMRATFQSAERTLRDDEVAAWSQQIIKALQGLGGTLRA